MTETIFTEMAEVDNGFDKFAPSNVAQLVGFLATDEAADVNAQIFVVFGGDIWVMNHFQPVGEVHRDKAWTPQDLIDAKGELFKGIPSGIFPSASSSRQARAGHTRTKPAPVAGFVAIYYESVVSAHPAH